MAGNRNRQGDYRRHGPKRIAARVYDYLENGGRKPIELKMVQNVNRFGVEAVFGRPLFLHEIREMIIAENTADAYKSRKASGDWAKWSIENPELADLLSKAAHG